MVQVEDKFKLLFIGDGTLEKILKEKIADLNINDRVFFGVVDNVNEIINSVDLITMSSLYEGLTLALVEA